MRDGIESEFTTAPFWLARLGAKPARSLAGPIIVGAIAGLVLSALVIIHASKTPTDPISPDGAFMQADAR